MKTAMKKLFSMMLVAVLLVGMLPFQAFATAVSAEPAPAETVSAEPAPAEPTPAEPAPAEPAPAEPAPAEPAPAEPAPAEPAPAEPAPVETIPPETTPAETTPAETTPAETTPAETTPAETTPAETTPVSDPTEAPAPTPVICASCDHEVVYGMCTGCFLNEGDCVCCDQCNGTTIEHDRKCPLNEKESTRGQVTLTLDYNHKGAENTKMKVDLDALLCDVVAGIPAPERDRHMFKYWTTDEAGTEIIDADCDARATRDGVVIYAQWADNITSAKGKYTVSIDLCYNNFMGEPIEGIAKGTEMGDILEYIEEPTRNGYKFDGWYWDSRYHDDVDADDNVRGNCTIYAKWDRRRNTNEVMLKIYRNGNTKSVSQIVDLYEYSRDGEISLSEVKEVVKKYYSAKTASGMSYDGLFNADSWSDYVRDHKNDRGSKHINVSKDSDTVVYVMVYNATTGATSSSSSAVADSTNPKTGDMIFMPAAVMGASVSALAVLFFLNKKRAVK